MSRQHWCLRSRPGRHHWNDLGAITWFTQGEYRHAPGCGAATPAMKPDARSINAEYGRGKRSLARARGRSPDRLKPLRDLYEGESVRAHRFRYGLLAFDLVPAAFIVVTSFLPRGPVVETLD